MPAQYKALHRKLDGSGGGGGGVEMMYGGEGGDGVEMNETMKVIVTFEDMLSSLREIRPSAMREVVLEVPKVSETTMARFISCDWCYTV